MPTKWKLTRQRQKNRTRNRGQGQRLRIAHLTMRPKTKTDQVAKLPLHRHFERERSPLDLPARRQRLPPWRRPDPHPPGENYLLAGQRPAVNRSGSSRHHQQKTTRLRTRSCDGVRRARRPRWMLYVLIPICCGLTQRSRKFVARKFAFCWQRNCQSRLCAVNVEASSSDLL